MEPKGSVPTQMNMSVRRLHPPPILAISLPKIHLNIKLPKTVLSKWFTEHNSIVPA
jgi:hypothetical protein